MINLHFQIVPVFMHIHHIINPNKRHLEGENSLALVQQKTEAVLSRPFRLQMTDILMLLFEVLFNKHFSIDFGSQRIIEMQIF